MKDKYTRRDFMTKSTVALGAAVACELTAFAGAGEIDVLAALAPDASKEETMPHINVKLWPGRSEEDKQRLADAIVEDVVNIIGSNASSVSVTIEEVSSADWKEKVYEPEIQSKKSFLYKKPGYSM